LEAPAAGGAAGSSLGSAGALVSTAAAGAGAGLGAETAARGGDGGAAGEAGFADDGTEGGAEAPPAGACLTKSRIRSTVGGSRLAKGLGFTSRFHSENRSINSWLFNPSSFANSCTRVDKCNSSRNQLRTAATATAR